MAVPVKGRALTAAFDDDEQSVIVSSNGSELVFRNPGEVDDSEALAQGEKDWVRSLFPKAFSKGGNGAGTCSI